VDGTESDRYRVMVSMLTSIAVVPAFHPRSEQTNVYKFGICYISAKPRITRENE